jgi:hypothetical protein
MIEKKKIAKLLERLQRLVRHLEEQRSLMLHQHVSQFYYMQSIEEIFTLFQQYEDQYARLELISERIANRYESVFHQWRKDVLWIHRCENCRN